METNNIYLGDAYELIKQLKDHSVDLIITDPPYAIEGIHVSGILKSHTFHQNRKYLEKLEGEYKKRNDT